MPLARPAISEPLEAEDILEAASPFNNEVEQALEDNKSKFDKFDDDRGYTPLPPMIPPPPAARGCAEGVPGGALLTNPPFSDEIRSPSPLEQGLGLG